MSNFNEKYRNISDKDLITLVKRKYFNNNFNELADFLNVHPRTIYNWNSGSQNLPKDKRLILELFLENQEIKET
jgi:hypothetical protein